VVFSNDALVHCITYLLFISEAYIIYFRYRGTVIGTRYGPGNGFILLDDVQCVGNETSITNCRHAGWNVHDCTHSEDVSVSCGTSPVHYGKFHNINMIRCKDISASWTTMIAHGPSSC